MPAGGASSPAGEVAGRDHGPVRTIWASQLGPRRPMACRSREQAERRWLLRRRRRYGGCGGRKRGAEGAAHDGEGVGAHGRTRESSGRQERGGGKLGQPTMAAVLQHARAGAVERGRGERGVHASEEESGELSRGSPHPHRAQGGTRQQSPSMVATSMDKCRPLRHFTEHVAGSDMGKVERRFGPLPGRIRP